MPRLTAIMPVKDGEQYLPTALASLAATLPQDSEVLVMDDGSTDSTPGLLAAAAQRDRRFVIHRHETSRGVATSLNELAARADCEYLARMDADDVVLVNRWHTSLAELEGRWGTSARSGTGRADLVFTSVLFIDETGRVNGMDQPGRISTSATPYHLLFGSMLVHPTLTMRRSVFEELGGYATVPAEDYEMWLRAASSGRRIVRTAAPGLKYRRHTAQVTARAPWSNPEPDSPLFAAYGGLLDRVLGYRPPMWRTAFESALGGTPLTEEGARATHALHAAVAAAAAESLGPLAAASVRWRARREWPRVEERTRRT